MIAAKFSDDTFYKNEYYARIGGVTKEELNELELDYLCAINFTLVVSTEDYLAYHNNICQHATGSRCPYCSDVKLPMLTWSRSIPNMLDYEYTPWKTFDSPCSVMYNYDSLC